MQESPAPPLLQRKWQIHDLIRRLVLQVGLLVNAPQLLRWHWQIHDRAECLQGITGIVRGTVMIMGIVIAIVTAHWPVGKQPTTMT